MPNTPSVFGSQYIQNGDAASILRRAIFKCLHASVILRTMDFSVQPKKNARSSASPAIYRWMNDCQWTAKIQYKLLFAPKYASMAESHVVCCGNRLHTRRVSDSGGYNAFAIVCRSLCVQRPQFGRCLSATITVVSRATNGMGTMMATDWIRRLKLGLERASEIRVLW